MDDKKNILFVVESAINKNDGYKSRIEMEMGLLADKYNFSILIPWENENVKFLQDVKIYTFNALDDRIPFVLNVRRLRAKLEQILTENSDYIVCFEALPAAVCGISTAKKHGCKVIFDCHGTAPDEAYLYHPGIIGKLYSKWLRNQQVKIVDKCDLLVTVSIRQYEVFDTEKPYVLLPMLPAEQFLSIKSDKATVRESIGIPDDALVFCYSGQNQKWQMSEDTVLYYSKIEKQIKNAFLMILTGSEEEFRKLCIKNEIKNYLIKKVPYRDMHKYLDAADYGFCLRENHIINLVASPTKVLEYLSRDIIPILTPYVGDFSKQLSDEGLCICLDNLEVLDYPKNNAIDGKNYVFRLIKERKKSYVDAIICLGDKNE